MSNDASTDSSPLLFIDAGSSYDYPNIDTYRSLRVLGATLQKGAIFSIGQTTISVNQSNPAVLAQTGGLVGGAGASMVAKQVDAKFYKRFQYNPAEIQFALSAVNLDPSVSTQQGGNLSNTGIGAFNVSFEMKFTRDTEVYRATMGLPGGRYNEEQRAIFGRIGVMKDVYDVLRVILSGDTDANGGLLPSDMTMRALSGRAFDLSAAGGALYTKPIAVSFNKDLVFYGQVQSLNFVFNKFNHKLVPTWATVNMTISCLNVRPQSQAVGWFGQNATTSASNNGSNTPTATPMTGNS